MKTKLDQLITTRVTLALTPLLFVVVTAFSAANDPKGLEIARKARAVEKGFGDQVTYIKMTLRNQHGQETTRAMKNKTLEVKGDGDKSLIIFSNPRDIKGTAFLSFTHKTGDDDQWLYLPALRRVKRISSRNKSGPFMGSEFSFEDIASQEVEKYTYKYIKEETLDGKAATVIERYPVDKNSGYTRQIIWYDAKTFVPLKIDYYDRKSAHLKTLTYSGYEKHQGKFWRAAKFSMKNVISGKSTILEFTGYKFGTGLGPGDFNKSSLARVK